MDVLFLKAHSQDWDNFGNWKPFKIDEKWSLFHLGSSSFSKYLIFLSCPFVHIEIGFGLKGKVIFNIYDITTCLTNNYNKIFPNISKSKGNQIINFGQWIEYVNRNIFLEKLCSKCGEETIPRAFLN